MNNNNSRIYQSTEKLIWWHGISSQEDTFQGEKDIKIIEDKIKPKKKKIIRKY